MPYVQVINPSSLHTSLCTLLPPLAHSRISSAITGILWHHRFYLILIFFVKTGHQSQVEGLAVSVVCNCIIASAQHLPLTGIAIPARLQRLQAASLTRLL
jgi:hypothetical protein